MVLKNNLLSVAKELGSAGLKERGRMKEKRDN